MKTVAIMGASGVVGQRALTNLLERSDVDRVVALGRRPLSVSHAKLTSKVLDLGAVAAMARELPDDPAFAVCCLGTTMKTAGSKEASRSGLAVAPSLVQASKSARVEPIPREPPRFGSGRRRLDGERGHRVGWRDRWRVWALVSRRRPTRSLG